MIKRRSVSDQRSFSKNAKTVLTGFLAFFITLFLVPLAVSAAGDVPTLEGVAQGSGLPMVSLTVFLVGILRIFFGLLGVIAVLLLIYGGFIWMTSQGDPAKVQKAKQIIYNTIIGLIVIFSAFAITSFLMAWLTGLGGGGGGGGGNIPGGGGDWSRSALGAGPIQSVYPAPNSVNVPINTMIAVTFKVNIKPDSICDLSGGGTYCNGDEMKNVSICETSATGTACLADSDFNAAVYAAGTTVRQASATDFKTFIFSPATYLGVEDLKSRTFKVVLESGISAAATNDSIFAGRRVNYYNWAFKTNGRLDLTPPEVAKLELYPNPDNTPDSYAIGTQSTAGGASIEIFPATLQLESPAMLNGTPFTGTPLSGINVTKRSAAPTVPSDYLKLSSAGFKVNSNITRNFVFTVSSAGDYIQFNEASNIVQYLGAAYSESGACKDGDTVHARCFPVINNKQVDLTGSGIVITSTGDFSNARGTEWIFTALRSFSGDTVSLMQGSSTVANFIAASDIVADQITKQALGADGKTLVTTEYFTFKSNPVNPSNLAQSLAAALNARAGGLISATVEATADPAISGKINVVSKAAGQNNLSLTTNNKPALVISGGLSGTDRVTNRTALPPGSKPDPYNNSVFHVTFSEAVNPINIDTFIKVKIQGVDAPTSATFSNQYRTVELMGTHPCGVNSCGKQMYCWLDPNTGGDLSVPANITINAASLKACTTGDQDSPANDWCKKFGGTCQGVLTEDTATQLLAKDYGRCKLPSDLYYPQAGSNIDGIIDMANNSFNGNFDQKLNAKNVLTGNAQGKSGTTAAGQSGQPYYDANDVKHLPSPFIKFSYDNDNDPNGDDFSWLFFISTQIDLAAPLLTTIIPTGDYSLGGLGGETFRDPVKLIFNTLMRLSTLQPGWGYGENTADRDWNIRYLTLKTITAGANPVGYWVNAINSDLGELVAGATVGDGAGDGLADYTQAFINHNPFDQAISYGPLVGSGVESITQNCFLPGNGPQNAGDANAVTIGDGVVMNRCVYDSEGVTSGCVSDEDIPEPNRVKVGNPSSYGYLNCNQIDGTDTVANCAGSNKVCKIQNATSTASDNGSWIITKDHPLNPVTGTTGCCFGKCFNAP